ncbi:MAG: hypothetical protein JXA51_05265 [Dehalococcoidales bacterium]|nr:hypothetical protein [Dehalococcoidales bacterium]
MAKNTDLTKLLRGYSNKWIALSADSSRVVGVATNPKKALEQAHKHKECSPILTKVPKSSSAFIL